MNYVRAAEPNYDPNLAKMYFVLNGSNRPDVQLELQQYRGLVAVPAAATLI